MFRLLLRQFTSPIMLVLIGATLLSILLGERVDGLIILVIVLISGLLGFVQEHRADRTMAALSRMVRIHADVLRGGVETEVPVDEVVVGDVVILRTGDIVPADIRLTASTGLLVDESAVTGESLASEKGVDLHSGLLPADRVYFGTHVVAGDGHGVVEAIGASTRFGALIARLKSAEVTTSFERSMTRFGFLLTQVMAILVAVVLIVQSLADRPILQALLFALALAVGITPQMLPAIVMVSLSAGARAMAARQVLIRRLDVIEDLGAMTLLCADKTGTLTMGQIVLDRAIDSSGADSDRVLGLAALNSGLQRSYRNAIDAAIIQARRVDGHAISEIPYDFQRRRSSVLVDSDSGRLLITKGAVSEVLACCTDTAEREAVDALTAQLGKAGFRVIALASRRLDSGAVSHLDESEMTFEGLLTFFDPPTDEAAVAITRLRELGVGVAVISGDNRYVTAAAAEAVGIESERVITGAEVDTATDEQLQAWARTTRVFAEVPPLAKERLINAFQSLGQTVGYLGDGINDVAALRRADVGIAVNDGADVAKQSAAIVVMTKSLDVIADATIMGRRTFANTLKYIHVTISANFGNVISMVVASFFLPFLPLLPVQILLLNLLSDAPALAISADAVDQSAVRKPQIWSIRAVRRFMVFFGLISSTIDIAAFVILKSILDVRADAFHSAWFLLSLLTEIIALLVLRTDRFFLSSRPARSLLAISALTLILGLVAVVTGIGRPLGLVPLGGDVLLVLLILGLTYLGANEAGKLGMRRRTP